MARYALIDPNEQIIEEKDEKRLDLSAGVRDGYSWRIIVNQVNDLSTPGNTDIKSSSAEFIEPAQVRRVRTVVDRTTQELEAEKDAIVDSLDTASRDLQYASLILTKDIISVLFAAVNELRVADGAAPLTIGQFATFFENNRNNISIPQMKAYLKARFG